MSEVVPERTSPKKIEEVKTAVMAVLRALKKLEDDTGECYMEAGTFLGIKFEEE